MPSIGLPFLFTPSLLLAAAASAKTPVSLAIDRHLAAVHADEAMFSEDGKAIDEQAAAETQTTEISAFRAFVVEPCKSPEDVQAKVSYLLAGTVGDRDRLIDLLEYPGYTTSAESGLEDDLRAWFLESLILPQKLEDF